LCYFLASVISDWWIFFAAAAQVCVPFRTLFNLVLIMKDILNLHTYFQYFCKILCLLLSCNFVIQVEICIYLCAGGDSKKAAQDVVLAADESSSSAVHAVQRLVQDKTTVHQTFS